MSEENDYLTSKNKVFIEYTSNNKNQTMKNLLNQDTNVNIIYIKLYFKFIVNVDVK